MIDERVRRIVPDDAELEEVARGLMFGEGPLWDHPNNQLYFVDIIGDTIWRWRPGVGKEVVVCPSGKANGLTFDRERRILVAGWGGRTVWRLDAADGTATPLCTKFRGLKLNSPNDIVMRSDGAIYFTDPAGGVSNVEMAVDDVQRYHDIAPVLRIPPGGGEATLVSDDFTFPNGLAFSPDETILYVNDTRQAVIKAFDLQPGGGYGPARIFYRLYGDEPGVADGMKVDREGNVYVTGPLGIHIVAPDGALLGRLRVPGHTTNLGWGDADWRSLFITTYTSVFRVRLGIAGIPV
ncbi:MAG: SMP-30/gluconolactonase/LRE family protein [Variibacter sp.]|nr:SMP-30/gluconolactonase/LRE family protein [Variibacter sp.]